MEHNLRLLDRNGNYTSPWNNSLTETHCKFPGNCTNALINSTVQVMQSCVEDCLTRGIKTSLWSLLLVVSLIGNILVVIVVNSNGGPSSAVDSLISSMCVSDLVIPLVAIPYRIKSLYVGQQWLDGVFGAVLCKLVPLAIDASTAVSVLSMLVIAIERYRGVLYPTKRAIITLKRRKIIIAITWVLSIAIHSFYFHIFKLDYSNLGQAYCVSSWYANRALDLIAKKTQATVLILCVFGVPFILLTFLYTAVVATLRRTNHNLSTHLEKRAVRRRKRQNRRITSMLMTVVAVFVVAYTPFGVFAFCWIYGLHIPCNVPFAALFLFYTYTAVNPIVYFVYTKKYRHGLRQMIPSASTSQLTHLHSRSRSRRSNNSPLSAQDESPSPVELQQLV